MGTLPSTDRTALIGYLIAFSAISYLIGLTTGLTRFVPALAAWIGMILAFPGMSRSARKQTLALLICGVIMIAWAAIRRMPIDWQQAIGGNMPLLAMFVAVSFLSLTNPPQNNTALPRARKGIAGTLATCHLLGAVINISIIFVVGDRLSKRRQVTPAQALVMMRSFTAAAFWSPFFVAIGVALTYAPGSEWLSTFLPGLILTLPMFAITFRAAWRRDGRHFEGYPLKYESLVIPVILATTVLLCHWLIPQVRILTLITLIAPVGTLLFMNGRRRLKRTGIYIQRRLAYISSQFALFLAAGIFSAGLVAIINSYPQLLRLELAEFSPPAFMAVSGLMMLVAMVGVHPVVSIALVSPFLQPLDIDPNQLAFMFLSVWGIGTGASPLSGVGLTIVGRYHLSAGRIIKMNSGYLLFMWLMTGLLNYLWFC